MKIFRNPWMKLTVFVFFIAAIFFVFKILRIDFSGITEEKFKSWVESLGFWGPLIYIVFYLFRPLIFFPAGVLSAAAGIIWGPFLGFFYLQVAANISANVEFLIGRYFCRGIVEKYLKGKFLSLDKRIERHGFLTVLLVRLIPNLAWDIQNLSLGLTKVKFRHYFPATLAGIMPGSFAFVFLGSSFIKVLFSPKSFWIILVAILFFAAIYYLQKYLKGRSKG